MVGTITTRISLEGAEAIRRKLEEMGKAGEQAFKQVQNAAAKPISDPAQVDKTKQAFDQLSTAVAKLSPQFKQLAGDAQAFGTAGAQASQKTTGGLNETAKAAEQTGTGFRGAAKEANNLGIRIGVVAGLVSAATNKLLGMVSTIRAALSPSAALAGTVETGKAISDQADKLKLSVPEWLKLSKAIADAGVSEKDFIEGTSKLAKTIDEAKGGFVSLVPGQLVSTSKGAVAVLTDLAKQVSVIGNETQKAALGNKLFGENWKDVVKTLLGTKAAAGAVDDIFDTLAKVDRAMRPEQAEKAARLAKGWDVLGKAIRAAKDQIGTVLLDSALLRAEWLIKLIDGARELFKVWQQLGEAKQAAFFKGLGDSPTAFLFKTLVALSDQLAGLWRDVLVPAGKALFGVFDSIAGLFDGITGSQVAAFFITAGIAAVGLALALKGIALVLSPLAGLLGLVFSPFGAVLLAAAAAAALFWDKLKAGAQTVAALIPQELAAIGQSFEKLFSGDFSGFWDQFSTAAVAAFGKIAAAAQETPWVASLVAGAEKIAADLPGAIIQVVNVVIELGKAAEWVAGKINKIFGTELTGTGVALLLIVAQLTGGLSLLATAIGIVAAALVAINAVVGIVAGSLAAINAALTLGATLWTAFSGVIGLVATGLEALMVLLGGPLVIAIVAVGAALVALALNWDTVKTAGGVAIDWLIGKLDGLISKIKEAANWVGSVFGGGGTPGETTPIPGNAAGGLIGGRGSGTSDSNLAWVSRGEHIMPAGAVRQPGVLAFLEALRRSGGDLSRVLDGMGRFATGGLVGLPALASGGLGGMSHVTIAFPGLAPISGLRASSAVVEELQRAAAMAQVRSGGRKPSRYT